MNPHRRTGRRSWPSWLLLAATLAVMTGCASLTSATGAPITDIHLIAGQWAGTMTPGREGEEEPFYLTITADGRLTAVWGANTAWGTVTIQNGQARFEMHPSVYEGTITLYDDGGKRQLVLKDLWDPFAAWVVPRR